MSAESPFALPKLLAFAESKRASIGYNPYCWNTCFMADFTRANKGHCVGYAYDIKAHYRIGSWKEPADRIPQEVMDGPHTFGALATRLRAALKDERK